MSKFYQPSDWSIVDYDLYSLAEEVEGNKNDFTLRGPKPNLIPKKYFVCFGAAQTFGRFCQNPYPNVLATKLGIPALNLSHGGVGASYFLDKLKNHPKLQEYIENASFAVIQVMSGRSQENTLFDNCRGNQVSRKSDGLRLDWQVAYRDLIQNHDPQFAKEIIEETRDNWVISHQELLNNIPIPKVLLWFSLRTPSYPQTYKNVNQLFGKYPQLVNEDMMTAIADHADHYVEYVSQKGIPQILLDRFTNRATQTQKGKGEEGRTWSKNDYYPSPDMHSEVADILEDVCSQYVNQDLQLDDNVSKHIYSEEIKQYSQILKSQPDDIASLNKLGELYERIGDFDQATKCFQYVTQLQAQNILAQARLARSIHKQGKYQEAIAIYKKVIQQSSILRAQVYADLGDALEQDGQMSESITAYKKSIEVETENISTLDQLKRIKRTIHYNC